MIPRVTSSLALLLFSVTANALTQQELNSLTVAVKEMCLVPDRSGDYLKVEGDAKAGLPVVVKIVKAELSGKLTYENWKGIPIALDKYKTDPRACANEMLRILVPAFGSQERTPKACRDKSHGIEQYSRTFDVDRWSNWMGGGFSEDPWCNDVIASLRGEHPEGQFEVLAKSQQSESKCPPFNCPQYRYYCKVRVKADPIYIEKISSACK